jgi:hypothetical protein
VEKVKIKDCNQIKRKIHKKIQEKYNINK